MKNCKQCTCEGDKVRRKSNPGMGSVTTCRKRKLLENPVYKMTIGVSVSVINMAGRFYHND